eukprot:gene21345-65983_t
MSGSADVASPPPQQQPEQQEEGIIAVGHVVEVSDDGATWAQGAVTRVRPVRVRVAGQPSRAYARARVPARQAAAMAAALRDAAAPAHGGLATAR